MRSANPSVYFIERHERTDGSRPVYISKRKFAVRPLYGTAKSIDGLPVGVSSRARLAARTKSIFTMMFLRRALPRSNAAARQPLAKPSLLRPVFLSFYFFLLSPFLSLSLALNPAMQLSRCIADSCATGRAVLPLFVKLSIFTRDNHHLPPD